MEIRVIAESIILAYHGPHKANACTPKNCSSNVTVIHPCAEERVGFRNAALDPPQNLLFIRNVNGQPNPSQIPPCQYSQTNRTLSYLFWGKLPPLAWESLDLCLQFRTHKSKVCKGSGKGLVDLEYWCMQVLLKALLAHFPSCPRSFLLIPSLLLLHIPLYLHS